MAKKQPSKSVPAKEVATLRRSLKDAEAKRDKWKSRAKKVEAANADLRSQLKGAQKQLRKLADPGAAPTGKRAPQGVADQAPKEGLPDASWTVAALRDEARQRGLTGMSNKPKSELLKALR